MSRPRIRPRRLKRHDAVLVANDDDISGYVLCACGWSYQVGNEDEDPALAMEALIQHAPTNTVSLTVNGPGGGTFRHTPHADHKSGQ